MCGGACSSSSANSSPSDAAHPDPHSFPTRRSSDLRLDLGVRPHRARQLADARRLERRSEEHTSELQSRGHLVCRLLLEKNKALVKERIAAALTPGPSLN